jgi:quercetin dioxygenase-like cupin family protein
MIREAQVLKFGQVILSTALILGSPNTLAEEPASEPALTLTSADAQLKWGPCPAFIPQGCEIAVLHGDPAQANADVFFKVPGDFTIPPHWHTSPERMVLVSGELQVTYDGQESTKLKPGAYAYGPAKLPHSAYCLKGAACVLFIAFEAPVDAVPIDNPAQ